MAALVWLMKKIEFLYYLPTHKIYEETIACYFENVSENFSKEFKKVFVGDRRNLSSKILDDYWNNAMFKYIKNEATFNDAKYFRKHFLEVL